MAAIFRLSTPSSDVPQRALFGNEPFLSANYTLCGRENSDIIRLIYIYKYYTRYAQNKDKFTYAILWPFEGEPINFYRLHFFNQ